MSDQGEEWIWYPEGRTRAQYSPVTFDQDLECDIVLVDPVPCELCGDECKPGEDWCWTCLGQTKPAPEEYWYVYGTNLPHAHNAPISGTTNWNTVTVGQLQIQQNYWTIPVSNTVAGNAYIFTAPHSLMVTGVSIQGNSWTISPGINVISGDQVSFQISAMIT